MASFLSSLVDNLVQEIRKTKWKDCIVFLKYKSVNDSFMNYKCLSSNKDLAIFKTDR